MTIREFEQKFILLERFAPGLCANEMAQTTKFIWGLRFAIKDGVVNQKPTNAVAIARVCVRGSAR